MAGKPERLCSCHVGGHMHGCVLSYFCMCAGHYWGSISTDSTCESVESADVVVAVGAVSDTKAAVTSALRF
jgi:hypothetical protein